MGVVPPTPELFQSELYISKWEILPNPKDLFTMDQMVSDMFYI